MNKQIQEIYTSKFNNIENSPLKIFLDEFFSDLLPTNLIVSQDGYPKYNILRANSKIKDNFTVELSVAGFKKEDLKIFIKDSKLFVKAETNPESTEKVYLFKGIASRDFIWSLKLPNHAKIEKAKLEDGILRIDIKIESPNLKIDEIEIE